ATFSAGATDLGVPRTVYEPESQSLVVSSTAVAQPIARDAYTVVAPPPPPPPPVPRAVFDPGSAKGIASGMVAARGWGASEFNCLVGLWQKESGWNAAAE